MRAVKVEFALRDRLPRWVWPANACLALAAVTGLGIDAAARRELASLQEAARIAEHDQRLREEARLAASRSAGEEPPYAESARELLRQARFPINAPFAALESAAEVSGARLDSIEIRTSEGTARAEVTFLSYDVLFQYLEVLNAGEDEPRWLLVSARVNQRHGSQGGDEIRAVITSSWKRR